MRASAASATNVITRILYEVGMTHTLGQLARRCGWGGSSMLTKNGLAPEGRLPTLLDIASRIG